MKIFKEIRFSNLKNMKIIYAHNENHLNLKPLILLHERKFKKKIELKKNENGKVATKDVLQPKDVLNVINTPYISLYFDLYLLLWFKQRFKLNHIIMITLKQ
jgi:hypothetical protein